MRQFLYFMSINIRVFVDLYSYCRLFTIFQTRYFTSVQYLHAAGYICSVNIEKINRVDFHYIRLIL